MLFLMRLESVIRRWRLYTLKCDNCFLDVALLKCINCDGHHSAGYQECEYMENSKAPIKRSRQWTQQYTTQSAPVEQQYIQAPPDLHRDFPALQRPYWQTATQQKQQQHQPRQQQPNVILGSDNSNLFNIQELQTIMSEILTKLRDCKSKEDQFNFMFNLAETYVYSP